MSDTATKVWTCPFCGEEFDGYNPFRKHRRAHPPEDRVIPCGHCDLTFDRSSARTQHVKSYHQAGYNEARFWSKVNKQGPLPEDRPELGPCWVWTRCTDTHGYGRFSIDEKHVSSHVYSWLINVGPVPEGLELDHLCRRKECCNPAHLEPVTHQENMRRGLFALREKCPHCDLVANRGNLARHLDRKHRDRLAVTQDSDSRDTSGGA